MSASGKMLRFTLIILVVFSLALAGLAGYLLQQQMQKTAILNQKLNDMLSQEKSAQTSLDNSRQEISRLSALLSGFETKIIGLEEKLTVAENEKRGLTDTVASITSQFGTVANKNAEYLKTIEDLKTKVEQGKKQLDLIAKEKLDLAGQLEKIQQQQTSDAVRLEKIVVTPGKSVSGITLEGKIVSVDKKLKFLIIGLGVKDGVNPGDIFVCMNNDKEIGSVRVGKVYESLSAADFLPELGVKFLKEGLKVIRK